MAPFLDPTTSTSSGHASSTRFRPGMTSTRSGGGCSRDGLKGRLKRASGHADGTRRSGSSAGKWDSLNSFYGSRARPCLSSRRRSSCSILSGPRMFSVLSAWRMGWRGAELKPSRFWPRWSRRPGNVTSRRIILQPCTRGWAEWTRLSCFSIERSNSGLLSLPLARDTMASLSPSVATGAGRLSSTGFGSRCGCLPALPIRIRSRSGSGRALPEREQTVRPLGRITRFAEK